MHAMHVPYLPSIPIGTCQRGAAMKRGKAALIGAAAWGLIYSTSQHYILLCILVLIISLTTTNENKRYWSTGQLQKPAKNIISVAVTVMTVSVLA